MNDFGLMAIESGKLIALRGVDVSARIAGLLAETTLNQKYRNDTEVNLELAYTFPLPVGAVLLSFEVQVGKRKYQGTVIPRKDAEVAYEGAISDGNSAFRLQEIKRGIYNATLGNVMAGESIEITLTYAEVLAWNGRSIRYRVPTTIAPRYGDPSGMQPWQRPVTSLEPEYPFDLTVSVHGPLANSSVACPSHKISFRPDTDSLVITLAAGATMDRDFILEIENESVQSLGISASARDTHVAMLTLLPPAIEPDEINVRDVLVVLDCSGSMMGDSMTLAKEGVLSALGSLSPKECFGVMGFGTQFEHFDNKLQPANRKNIDLARKFVGNLGNLGGTELRKALELALAYSTGHPMDVLLLTDGEVWGIDKVIQKAKKQGVRIFTVGIGSAVAEDTVRALADQTGGSCELVAPNEDMSARIFRHFNRMRQPEANRLDIQWPSQPIWESRPTKGCFAGDAYTVVAAFDSPTTEAVCVTFEFSGVPTVSLIVPVAQASEISDSVVRIAAKQYLAQLPALEQQDWAVRYKLITQQTDFLITMDRAADERAVSNPELQVVPQMLPAGWGGTSTVVASDLSFSAWECAAPTPIMHLDVPAVLRRRSAPKAACKPHPYVLFLQKLSVHSNRKFFGALPKTKAELVRLGLPVELSELFNQLVYEGNPANDVLLALYQALTEHDGRVKLGTQFVEKARETIGNWPSQEALVARFMALLNHLWAEHENVQPAQKECYDIPAFLRNEAD